jgi:hypothetical protein
MTLEKSTPMRAIMPTLVALLFVVSAAAGGHAAIRRSMAGLPFPVR